MVNGIAAFVWLVCSSCFLFLGFCGSLWLLVTYCVHAERIELAKLERAKQLAKRKRK